MTSKSNCQKCGQTFEFEASEFEESGQTTTHIFSQAIDCPTCGNKTVIAVEKPKLHTFDFSNPEDSEREQQGQQDDRIYLSYFLAIFVPLAGFFSGVYLMAKNEHGHGAACMGISVFCSLIWLAIIF